VTDPDHPLGRLTAETGEEIYGKAPQIVPLNWGTSPCYLFTDRGVPVVSPGVGYAGNRTHGPNEHVRLADFQRAARHLARLADRFGKGEG
jgi:acetylornithine deacetylase/succinyl-diaminopimelate desuccinylase-like protein